MGAGRPVAIIGAGLAGLAAARWLCARDLPVRLFEANSKAGGCCATTQLEGYTFNDGAGYLAMPDMLDHLFYRLGLERDRLLPLRKIPVIQTTSLPDGTLVVIGDGPEIVIEGTDGAAATARLRAELEIFLRRWEPTLRFLAEDVMLHALSLPRMLASGWRHFSRLRGTVASHLNRSFSSDSARAALAGMLLFAGVPPTRMPAFMLPALVAMLRDGCFVPEGGMGRIPEVLSDAVLAQGGEIRLHAKVHRILLKNGRVCAIEVEGEGVVEVAAVISSVSAMHTFCTLLSPGEVPSRTSRKVRRAVLSHKGLVLQLGLSNKFQMRSHFHCVLPWLNEQEKIFKSSAEDLPWPIYAVPTATLPELAPPDCSIVEVFPPINQTLAPEDWSAARKQEVAARAIERLRRDYPIEIAVQRILSPREFRDRMHLYAGALYGSSPVAGAGALFKHRSPIPGLYLAGQTTWPGFGVSSAGISGVLAAEALFRGEMP